MNKLTTFWLRGLLLLGALLSGHLAVQAQGVGIGTTTPNAAAALDISSTTKGVLLPRLTKQQRDALGTGTLAAPVPGLVIYQSDNTPGLYAYNGTSWVRLGADNLGNHTVTLPVQLNNQPLTNNGTGGLRIDNAGNVGIGTSIGLAAGTRLTVQGGHLAVDDGYDLTLRDTNHGLGYYGSSVLSTGASKLWNGVAVDGPVLYSYSGGLLGTRQSCTLATALSWNSAGNVGIGTTNPRGRLDVAGSGDTYLVENPASGTNQNVFLPGSVFVSPFSGSSGTAFVQARVPSPTASTNIGLTLRTTSAGTLTDAVAITPSGRVGIGTSQPTSAIDVRGISNDIHTDGAVLARALVTTEYQTALGPSPSDDYQYHTAQCNSGWGISLASVYVGDHADGLLTVNCTNLTYLLRTTDVWRNGPDYSVDNQAHALYCNGDEVATGVRFYATTYFDGGPDLHCQQVAVGVTRGQQFLSAWRETTPYKDHTVVPFGCPPGTYLVGLAVSADTYIDSNFNPFCATLTK